MKFWVILAASLAVASAEAESKPESNADAEAEADPKAKAEADAEHPVPLIPVPVPHHHPAPYTPAPYTPAPYAAAPYTPAPYAAAPYSPAPAYGYTPAPYAPAPYAPAPYAPAYPAHPAPAYGTPEPYGPPACAKLYNDKPYCLEDPEYPKYEIETAIEHHYDAVQQLYKDVLANTENSVDRLKDIVQETYLCPSVTKYIQPLRAINTHGKWRVVVNHVKAHYETLSQTARIEECEGAPGTPCPLVPACYETKCVQKAIYHRFLVYDSYDKYHPFAIESFKLPSACACLVGTFAVPH